MVIWLVWWRVSSCEPFNQWPNNSLSGVAASAPPLCIHIGGLRRQRGGALIGVNLQSLRTTRRRGRWTGLSEKIIAAVTNKLIVQ